MKVKKFIAPNMPEAMKMIRNELGKDAVILNSKVVQKGGIFGFFTKKNIEVIAAVDPQPIPKKQPVPGPLNDINQFLSDQEIELQLRKEIMSFLLEKWYVNKGEADFEKICKWGKEYLVNSMSSLSFGAIDFSKKYINVVGPTGVGKTTTLAKIAAQAVLKYEKKVAFITTDTYRIAAIDQLKTYAKILNVPMEVTYTLDDFAKAKEKFSDFDLILIDTAGRNFRNKQYVEDLKSIIGFDDDLETILVLALTSKFSDMLDIFEQFTSIKIDKFIFTKVDETSKYGTILNLILKYKIGVAYLTNGQNVPDDIFEASPESIANTIFGVNAHERSS